MTRSEAREYLRSIHPVVLQHAILRELDIGDSIVDRAEHVVEVRVHSPDYPSDAEDLEDAVEYRFLRMVEQVKRGRRFHLLREDLAELLASEIPAVRLLAIRLSARNQ